MRSRKNAALTTSEASRPLWLTRSCSKPLSVRWPAKRNGALARQSNDRSVPLNWRRNGQGQAVVRYRLGGRRFECIIDTESLQIMDAGICLSGADEELNLSSLPSAVREAIESGQLHVFRNI